MPIADGLRRLLPAILIAAAAAGMPTGAIAAPSTPVIYSLSPASGPIGTTITVEGANFTPENNTLQVGGGYIQWLPSSRANGGHQAIVVTLRAVIANGTCPGTARCPVAAHGVSPGANAIRVQNANGTSNQATFTVTR